jgi:hypothetical protein
LKDFPGIPRQLPFESINANAPDSYDHDLMKALFGGFHTMRVVAGYMIYRVMKLAEGRQKVAADVLGISRQGHNIRLRWPQKYNASIFARQAVSIVIAGI